MNKHGMPYFLEFFRSMFSFRWYSHKNSLYLRLER